MGYRRLLVENPHQGAAELLPHRALMLRGCVGSLNLKTLHRGH